MPSQLLALCDLSIRPNNLKAYAESLRLGRSPQNQLGVHGYRSERQSIMVFSELFCVILINERLSVFGWYSHRD